MAGDLEAAPAHMLAAITVKTVGPPTSISSLRVPSAVKVCRLRALVAEDRELPSDKLKLAFRGMILHDKKKNQDGGGDDELVKLVHGDSLIVFVDNWMTAKMFLFLSEKMRIPDILLMAIYSLTFATWYLMIWWFFSVPERIRFHLPAYWAGITLCRVIPLYIQKRRHAYICANWMEN